MSAFAEGSPPRLVPRHFERPSRADAALSGAGLAANGG